jgi:hypothetical protein
MKDIRIKIEAMGRKRKAYVDDKENPTVEVWKWVLVVP